MNAQHTIVWQALAWPGAEYLEMQQTSEGIIVKSYLTGSIDQKPYALAYKVELTPEWQVKRFGVWSLANVSKQLVLSTDLNGKWFDHEGVEQPQFEGCYDIDLSITPFTNSLPINRMEWYKGRKQRIEVLYVRLPDFEPRRVAQFYTQLEDSRYFYRDGTVDFTSDLTVDNDGLIIEYPGLFTRAFPIHL
jgi:hypothetical protein